MLKIVHRYWFYATVALVPIVASLVWELHQTKQALKNIFHYSFQVTVQDSETGEVLYPLIEHPTKSSDELIAQRTGSIAYEDGSMRISGIGYKPHKIIIRHNGYKSQSLTMTSDSPFTDHVRIALRRTSGIQEN